MGRCLLDDRLNQGRRSGSGFAERLRRGKGSARDPRMRYARAMSPDHSSRPWEHAGMRIEGERLEERA